MKQSTIILAYKTLENLVDNEHFTKAEQWEFYKVRKALRPHFDFQIEQENKLRDKFMDFADKDGNLPSDKTIEFMQGLNEIGSLDVEVQEIDKPKIPMVEGMTFKQIEPLEDFIEFLPPA